MAIDFTKYGVPVSDEEAAQYDEEQKSALKTAGEFLAPTTTGAIETLRAGERPTLRQVGGAALEIGAFAIPAGAIARVLGIVGRLGIKGLQAVKAVKTEATVGERAGQFVREVGRQTRVAAAVGGVSGALLGAGRALGDEEATPTEIAGEAAITGAVGAVGGAVLAPIVSFATAGVRGVTRFVSRSIKEINRRLKPKDKEIAVDVLTESYTKSFVQDKAAINNALDSLAVRSRRTGGPTTKEGLSQELAEEGFLPDVEGKLANMRSTLDELADLRSDLAKRVDVALQPVKTKTTLASLQTKTKDELKNRFDIDIIKTEGQVDKIFESLKKQFGANLSGIQLNAIRKKMNLGSKSFDKERFIIDAQYAIANSTREAIDKLKPGTAVRQLNKEIGRLFRIQETAEVFHNKVIDTGELAKSIGRYGGTIGLTGILGGIGGAVTGVLGAATGGGLVIAGIAAKLGGDFIAKLIRNSRFNPKIMELIRQGIDRDAALKTKLLKEASSKDKSLLEKVFKEEIKKP